MEMRIELIPVPVTDVDASIDFYTKKVGFHLDMDHKVNEDLRFVQLTPPGSKCSIVIGEGITKMKPGSLKGIQMVIQDAHNAHDELRSKGVAVSEVEVMDWGSFVYFDDPDGNSWSLQELPYKK